jgi:hydrogenase nickel incorporation protein HypA/HybF
MHELMVAQSLLAAISGEAAKHKAKPVRAKVSCGQLYAINDEALCFAFEAIARGTPCEKVRLEIEHKPIKARCRNCGHSFEISCSAARCARCSSEDFELLPDAPLLLEEIEFDME